MGALHGYNEYEVKAFWITDCARRLEEIRNIYPRLVGDAIEQLENAANDIEALGKRLEDITDERNDLQVDYDEQANELEDLRYDYEELYETNGELQELAHKYMAIANYLCEEAPLCDTPDRECRCAHGDTCHLAELNEKAEKFGLRVRKDVRERRGK